MFLRYEREQGLLACYDDDKSPAALLFRAHHIALAYDLEALSFLKLGEYTEVITWATEYTRGLRTAGKPEEASRVAVVELHLSHSPLELTKLAQNPDYLPRFLQNARLI